MGLISLPSKLKNIFSCWLLTSKLHSHKNYNSSLWTTNSVCCLFYISLFLHMSLYILTPDYFKVFLQISLVHRFCLFAGQRIYQHIIFPMCIFYFYGSCPTQFAEGKNCSAENRVCFLPVVYSLCQSRQNKRRLLFFPFVDNTFFPGALCSSVSSICEAENEKNFALSHHSSFLLFIPWESKRTCGIGAEM